MKQIYVGIALIIAALLMLLPTGCSTDAQEQTSALERPSAHNFSAWQIIKTADYTAKGELVRHCLDDGCAEKETKSVYASSGLTYTPIDGGVLVSGVGSCTDALLYISAHTPDGKHVIGIADCAFLDNNRITDAVIEKGAAQIGNSAFTGCTALETVLLPQDGAELSPGAFSKCEKLRNILFPASLQTIPMNCFDECSSLLSVDLPDTIETIGYSAFDLCTSLRTVRLPAKLKTLSACAFSDCTALEEVIFNDGLEFIEDNAFSNCTALTDAVLPASLKMLGFYTFFKATSLRTVFIPGSVETVSAPSGLSPFYLSNPDLVISTDAPEKPAGWDEHFAVYIVNDASGEYESVSVQYNIQNPARSSNA